MTEALKKAKPKAAKDHANAVDSSQWTLQELVLKSCQVQRGDGDPRTPGKVSSDQTVSATYSRGMLTYEVAVDSEFHGQHDNLIGEIAATFLLSYEVGGKPTPQDVDDYVPSVVLHAVPFVRELLSSMTNRMGLQPFLLPIVRQPRILPNGSN